MREEINQLIDKMEEPYGLAYYKGIPICDMSRDELYILCTWLIEICFKGETSNKKEETYVAHIDCYNCEATESVNIPKSITIKRYKSNRVCSDCGCMMDRCI